MVPGTMVATHRSDERLEAVLEPAATEMITLLLILAFSFTPIALGITVWLSASTLPSDVKPVATETDSELSE